VKKILFLLLLIIIGIIIFSQSPKNNQIPITNVQNSPIPSPTLTIKKVTYPFTVQAPDGDWKNPMFQDGCEEATALMAECTIHNDQCPIINGVIDKEWAKTEIIKISEWERETYGSSTDTSVSDTAARLLKNYFKISEYEVRDLKSSSELKSGMWILPMNGQKLGNPNYTAPGPERHMILIIGYDPKTNEVITNDAGTRKGKNYRYKLNVFWEAIRDYPTGEHLPILSENKKGILVKP